MASVKSTPVPPGCKLANLDMSYTLESITIHWCRMSGDGIDRDHPAYHIPLFVMLPR